MPERMTSLYVYDAFVDVIYRFARSLTRLVQGGPMAPQISVTLLAGVLAMVYALFHAPLSRPVLLEFPEMPSLTEFLIYIVAMLAAIITVQAKSRLSAIISLGVVGVAVTIFFIIYSAPDLAITQLLIEVLTVVLLVLVFFRVKPDAPIQDSLRRRVLRLLIALSVGAFGFGIVLINHLVQVGPSISPYFLENALPIGQGGNVVNVILVDIRGYDTLGEITVLGLAALGGYAVLRSPQLHALRRKIAAQRQEDKRLAAGGGDD
jgi:multicomponent Na+:H+ antiporter subunit A